MLKPQTAITQVLANNRMDKQIEQTFIYSSYNRVRILSRLFHNVGEPYRHSLHSNMLKFSATPEAKAEASLAG